MRLDNLKPDDVGRWVIYTDSFTKQTDKGRLKSWNDKTVFVVFKCGGDWSNFQNYTGEGCSPTDVRFEATSPVTSWLGDRK
jgi:hypothetical protein